MNIKETAVFAQTNDAASNQVVVFSRGEDGGLASVATYDTGGRGTGSPHLPSQGSVLAADGRVLVVNAGSDDVSVFAIDPDGLALVDRAPAGPSPRSVAAHGDLVYVLGTGGLTGLRLSGAGELAPIEGSARLLSASEADGAQVSFTPSGDRLVVTERVTDAISIYAVATTRSRATASETMARLNCSTRSQPPPEGERRVFARRRSRPTGSTCTRWTQTRG
jgi:6-phosphogluconolactonase (cycloisomerase 2 family)